MSEPQTPTMTELVSSRREWVESVINTLSGPLPSGRIGDVVFLLRDQLRDALDRPPSPPAAQPVATAWRVYWVSLNTSRTELFEEHDKATAKAHETGGCVIPLYAAPPPAAGMREALNNLHLTWQAKALTFSNAAGEAKRIDDGHEYDLAVMARDIYQKCEKELFAALSPQVQGSDEGTTK